MGMLHGGRRPIDIYRRIYSGINGTPMPSSKDPSAGETPEQRSEKLWHLVHFVTAVIEHNEVPPAEQAAIDDVLKKAAKPVAPPAKDDAEAAAGIDGAETTLAGRVGAIRSGPAGQQP